MCGELKQGANEEGRSRRTDEGLRAGGRKGGREGGLMGGSVGWKGLGYG